MNQLTIQKKIRVNPEFDPDISSAELDYETPYGLLSVRWEKRLLLKWGVGDIRLWWSDNVTRDVFKHKNQHFKDAIFGDN